jgi:class 3 adenylate cyclase
MLAACPACGKKPPGEFRFCPHCGAPLGREGREQRKTVTVLFCDVAGSTALGESTDPEALRALLARYFERMKTIVESHGGTVEKFIGDAVMAVFGVPASHEDDALRACRAAVEMRDALPELGIRGRIGVNTGEVVVGTIERLATGDALNVAARLEQAAQPGAVLIGQSTHALVREAVMLEPLEPLILKGKSEPVTAHRLIAVLDAPERSHVLRFVGRESELARIVEAWDRAQAQARCELVTVVGDAGVGKSRLVVEALAQIEARVARGRSLPYGDGITYWPVVEVVKQLAVLPTDPVAAAAIRSLLGESEAGTSGEAIAWAFRKLLEEQAPLVVVFDDLQWGDETFLDLVESTALHAETSFLLLCMARPELLERRPGWPGTQRLEPLPPEQANELIGDGVPEELRARIALAAGGNPLFISEMLAIAAGNAEVEVPPTLRALLAARLDQLDETERRLLERGSVEGEIFHRGAAQSLSPDGEVTPWLSALVRKGLIEPDKAQFPGEDAFRFHHQLLRDAAYDTLPKRVRAELHERLADWLEQRGKQLVELDEIVGHHLEQAARFRNELGETDEELSTRASRRLAAAGRHAGAHRNVAAVGLLTRALSLLPSKPELRAPLLLELAQALGDAGHYVDEIARLEETIAIAKATGDRATAAWGSLFRCFTKLHIDREYSAQQALVEGKRVLSVFSELGDPRGQGFAWGLAAYSHWFRGEHVEQRAAAEHALQLGKTAADERLQARSRYAAVAAAFYGPTPLEEAIEELEQLLRAPGGREDDYQILLGQAYAMQGRWPEARAALTDATARLQEFGNDFAAAVGAGRAFAELELLAGNSRAAEEHLTVGFHHLERRGEILYLPAVVASLGAALCAQGRYVEAERYAHMGARLAAPDNRIVQVQWRTVRARVLASATGAPAEAARFAREAVAHAEQTDNLNLIADAHAANADVLRMSGRDADAAAEADQAVSLYTTKGNAAALDQLRRAAEATNGPTA